jgi:hypothetical protein
MIYHIIKKCVEQQNPHSLAAMLARCEAGIESRCAARCSGGWRHASGSLQREVQRKLSQSRSGQSFYFLDPSEGPLSAVSTLIPASKTAFWSARQDLQT